MADGVSIRNDDECHGGSSQALDMCGEFLVAETVGKEHNDIVSRHCPSYVEHSKTPPHVHRARLSSTHVLSSSIPHAKPISPPKSTVLQHGSSRAWIPFAR